MDELPTETISVTGLNHETVEDDIQEIEGILLLLQSLMDSVRENVEQECLESAISLLHAVLDNGITVEEGRTTVDHQLLRALLVRYGVYAWIEDLDHCMNHFIKYFAEAVGVEKVEKFLLVCQGSIEKVPDVQVATQLINVFQRSINVATLDSLVCTATEALGSYNSTYLGDKLRHQAARLWIILGKALVLKYLSNSDVAALDQATQGFHRAEFNCLKDTTLTYISLTALQQVEWLRFIEIGDIGALLRGQEYYERAIAADEEGRNLYEIGVGMVDHAVDDAQLQEGIAFLVSSLHCRMENHPQRCCSLNKVACALQTSFERKGDLKELESSIALEREALDLHQPPHPNRSGSLNNLANSLATRFEHKGAFVDLEECIALHREALDLHQPPHPDRSILVNNLALSLSTRFQHKGAVEDLEESIVLGREVLDLCQPPHPNRSTSLNNLANSLSTRFKHKGAYEDLGECIALHREALDLHRPPHPNRSGSLNNLASCLSTRFQHKGAFEDLQECIALHREALNLHRPPHPNRSTSLNNLASSLSRRFELKGEFEDVEECIALCREALDLDLPSHSHRSGSLNNLANALSIRFQHKGAFEDVEECIALHREALDLHQPPHPSRSSSLNNLASCLSIRFQHKGAFEDLEECIALHREALDLHKPPHPNRSMSLNNLASCLSTRFQHKGTSEDLEECIALHREALDLHQAPHPDCSMSLINLASSLSIRFQHKGAFVDLEECIALEREALDLRRPPHSSRSGLLNNLANSLSIRFQHKRAFEDLEECIALHREALDLHKPPHPNRSMSLNNLASCLLTRFGHKRAFENLEECIALCREALDLDQPPHPMRTSSLNNLANSLSIRFMLTTNLQDIEMALEYYQDAAKHQTGSIIHRLRASENWATSAQNHCPLSTLNAYKYSMELLPQLASLDLTLQQRQDVLQHGRDLVGNAARSAINAGQCKLAVTFLSIGRSIFWSQALHLRSPVDDLMVTNSDIAQRFIFVSRQLENASYSQDVSMSGSRSSLAGELHPGLGTYKRLHLLANERQEIIKEIQSIPGYESFLQPPSFSTLQPAAKNGPVIMLFVSKLGCDALILRVEGSVEHIPLPAIDLKVLQVLKLLIHTSLGARAVTVTQDVRDSLQDMLGRDMVLETSSSITRDEALWITLEKLWISVVKPVIDALGIEKTSSPQRLWWCPTGLFSSLPIHAAGIYSEDGNKPIDCLFHYAVSSYCTSPQDLLHLLRLNLAQGILMRQSYFKVRGVMY